LLHFCLSSKSQEAAPPTTNNSTRPEAIEDASLISQASFAKKEKIDNQFEAKVALILCLPFYFFLLVLWLLSIDVFFFFFFFLFCGCYLLIFFFFFLLDAKNVCVTSFCAICDVK